MTQKMTFMDLDAVAYTGACIAEKTSYRWDKKDGSESSEVFAKAKDAKHWFEEQVEFGFIEAEEWVREAFVVVAPIETAIKGVEGELKKWMNAARKHFDVNTGFKGYLTSSGRKNKDTDGIQDRYQFNRYLSKHPDWESKPKPKYLSEMRSYLISSYDWIKMSPKGVEADACVVYFAEKAGLNGCVQFKDKDLRQAGGTNILEMNGAPNTWELETTTQLGELSLSYNAKGEKVVKGSGFKLVCFQTLVGDTSDGYKGVKGFGKVAGYELFHELETVEDCCDELVHYYENKFPEGLEYKDWQGNAQHRSARELLVQHMKMAYHERGPKDKVTPIERFFAKENPIFKTK